MTSAPVATQLVLYDNDAVDVSYSDGARLRLSPCGASFVYHQPAAADQHPLLGSRTVHQRTQYTISSFRDQVHGALDYRNRFAERPYVCKDVLDHMTISKLHMEVCDASWPVDIVSTDIKVLPDGSLRLSSQDGHASVTLAPCQQLLTARYLCQVGQTAHRRKHAVNKASESLMQEISSISHINSTTLSTTTVSATNTDPSCLDDSAKSEAAAILDEARWDHTWVTQHFSVLSFPDSWQHPCQALLQFAKKNSNSVHFEDDDENKLCENPRAGIDNADVERTCILTSLPKSLPLNCLSAHLHKGMQASKKNKHVATETQNEQLCDGRLKVICCQGVIYRFVRAFVEIYPGDGSVLRSTSVAGHYFTHYVHRNGKVEERIHAVLHAPPDIPGAAYSISKLLTRGARFLEHFHEQSMNLLDGGTPVCWQEEQRSSVVKEPLSSVILEECNVDGVGRFTAHSSGRVRILFCDRTALDMVADWSPRFSRCMTHSDGLEESVDIQKYHSQTLTPCHMSDLPVGMCRLLLPNGHYQYVTLNSPGQHHRYTEAAEQWVRWVNTSPGERSSFYKDTIHDTDRLNAIQQEITKIRCFNYIVENKVMGTAPQMTSNHGDNFTGQNQSNRCQPQRCEDKALETVVMATDSQQAKTSGGTNRPVYTTTDDSTHTAQHRSTTLSSIHPDNGTFTSLSIDPRTATSHCGDISFVSVQAALQQTSRAIRDLDTFLAHNGETQPVRDSSR